MSKSNKKVKQMIESITGGVWVNDTSSRKDKPVLWFFLDEFLCPDECSYIEYHRTVSIKASEVK